MLDIVTFETAKKLKEAGFPQPSLEDGQFWYSSKEQVICFGHTVDNWCETDYDVSAFAPTATDILRQIPGANLKWNGSTFVCKYRGKVDDTNPAECAAKMWLKIFANA